MWKHRYATALAVITFFLLILGGIVHNTGSSLACPDWPLCYGSLMPEMKGSVAIEHSHRLLASVVGLLTIGLVFILKNRLSVVALFLVVLQGLLGGLTVIYRLPPLVSTAHLTLSMIFFSVLIVMAWRTRDLARPPSRFSGSSKFILFVTLSVFLQNLLGALVRHTGAGLICPDIPFCNGSPWPSGLHPIFQLHMAHRWMGVLVALLVAGLAISLWKISAGFRVVRFHVGSASLLVLIQIGLGLATVVTQKAVIPVTAHLAVAALLLGTMVSLQEVSA